MRWTRKMQSTSTNNRKNIAKKQAALTYGVITNYIYILKLRLHQLFNKYEELC